MAIIQDLNDSGYVKDSLSGKFQAISRAVLPYKTFPYSNGALNSNTLQFSRSNLHKIFLTVALYATDNDETKSCTPCRTCHVINYIHPPQWSNIERAKKKGQY